MVETFASQHLQGKKRVLHVARAASAVTERLAAIGFDVTTVAASQLADLTETFDAIVFTHSLSAVASLETTVEHAARLLAPQGRLIVDDIDIAAPDGMALRWFYDVQELLAVAGVYAPSRVHPATSTDPVVRWRAGLERDGVIHGGTDMRVAISARFVIRELRRVEGFYRLIAEGIADDKVVAHVRTIERRMISTDAAVAIGLRLVADRATRA